MCLRRRPRRIGGASVNPDCRASQRLENLLFKVRHMSDPQFAQFDGEIIDGLRFCSLTYKLFDKIRGAENGPSRLRMRDSQVEKKLLEELLPICKYIQAKYRAGKYISVRWASGSQQFDAQVIQTGA